MTQFKMKPREVEGFQLTRDNVEEVALWCGGQIVEEIDPHDGTNRLPAINVPTMGGNQRAHLGWYVFRGGLGMYHVRDPESFEGAFEEA